MQSVAIQQVGPGVKLARDAVGRARIVCRQGTVLTRRDIVRLLEAGVRTVYVSDEEQALDRDLSSSTPSQAQAHAPAPPPPPPAEPVIPTETYEVTKKAVSSYLTKLKETLDVDTGPVLETVGKVVDAVLAKPRVVVQLDEIRTQRDFVYGHCVGVCTLSIVMGLDFGLPYRDLKALAAGAILHDVGKVKIADPVWNKPGRLTDEEYELVKTHTTHGFEILRRRRELDLRSTHIAYQHHERYDGKGYPRGLAGEEILLFARIAAVADVFDALTSDRPYRPAWPSNKAFGLILEESGKAFDPQVVRVFARRVRV